MTKYPRHFTFLALFLTLLSPLQAAKKVALIIGNADYNVGRLNNPVNDARSLTKSLRDLGFTVLYKPNLASREAMELAVEEFSAQISSADIALFYYSGHGVQRQGNNYLMPTKSVINKASHVRHRAMNVSFLMDEMTSHSRGLNLVILDACRDDPYPRDSKSGATRGLGRMDAPSSTIIAYATKPNATAADGSGQHSPYTLQLLRHLQSQAHRPIDDLLNSVNVAVENDTQRQQSPRLEMSPLHNIYCFATCSGSQLSLSTQVQLTVKPSPSDASVRILNIVSKYQDGIGLQTDKDYKIEVARLGYKRQIKTVRYQQGGNQVLSVVLEQESRNQERPAVTRVSTTEQSQPYTDPITGMKFVPIQPDCFQMGSNFGQGDEKPVHRVCLSAYAIGKYEVTQAQWQKVMGNNPSSYKGSNKPVEQVSWDDVQGFIRKLNQQTQQNYRLPTEAEWEYACRSGGKEQEYCGSNNANSVAWYGKNSGSSTHDVGQKQANGSGLYDMSGNVYEWVSDWYDKGYYKNSPTNNPQGPSSGRRRVYRGGGWYDGAYVLRSADRYDISLGYRHYDVGFRLVRKP